MSLYTLLTAARGRQLLTERGWSEGLDFHAAECGSMLTVAGIRLILDDNARVASVRFQVKCAGQLMAESWASEVVILPGQPVRKWVCRSEIQYVANEARHAITEQAQAFRSFVHAA